GAPDGRRDGRDGAGSRRAGPADGLGLVLDGRFVDRVCLVTGGGRGIGRAIALALAAEGGVVGVVARTRWQCEEVASAAGGVAIVADVAVEDDCERAVTEITSAFGPPGVLVNAAGISPVRQRAENH